MISKVIENNYFTLGSKAFARWDYLPKPIISEKKNQALIKDLIQKNFDAVGALNREKFSALFKLANKKTFIFQGTEAEFFRAFNKHKNAKLNAISPFVPFTNPPEGLHSLFRFDIGH